MTAKITTNSGQTLTRGATYAASEVPALAAAFPEHSAHGLSFRFLGWGQQTGRPTFGCGCGARLSTAPEVHPLDGHDIGCAVASGIACDCRR